MASEKVIAKCDALLLLFPQNSGEKKYKRIKWMCTCVCDVYHGIALYYFVLLDAFSCKNHKET